ncbi:hypothetical protein IR083_07295 [Dysgonomonas sp. GY75]|uniref:DUF6527 family protein n=1 Tax=Dysgonomonas sp. GY75 TaxID=2780419 RepID=UPI00188483CA|nr:DUF6527 family protein [Dysgonomonas sp. GY75]MBF0648620.1 hypothetical protein [Dysgonomonas sp. GY75]
MKFREVKEMGKGIYELYCPGCRCRHHVWTGKNVRPYWDFNGDTDKPTVSPSILVTYRVPAGDRICHFFIRDGRIQYLNDCTHGLRGKTLELSGIDAATGESLTI